MWNVIKRSLAIWSQHKASRLAAGVAFYAMLALAPSLVVLLNIMTLVYGHEAQLAISQQFGTVVGQVPNGSRANPVTAVQQVLQIAAESKHGAAAAVTSFVIALFSGSSLFAAIQDAIVDIWDIQPRRFAGVKAIVRNRLLAGSMLFVITILLIASLVLSAVISTVVPHLEAWTEKISLLGEAFISYCVVTALFAIVYRYLPAARIAWRNVLPGALIAGALFILGRIGLYSYFKLVSTQNAYGAAGSLAAFLIWIYFSTTMIFFGAAFTRACAESRGDAIKPE